MANNYCVSFFLFFTTLVFLLPKSCPQSTNQSGDEHQVLLGLERYWGSSHVLGRWNPTSSNHCSWGGVTCTNGMVTAIILPNQTFRKPVPPSLCHLKNLTYLDLSYNNFSTPFPTVLYNCSNLKYLDLSNNAFAGQLTADINSLSAKLEHLNLSANRIRGKIPASIGQFPVLKSLILDTNQFDGSYPAQNISNLTKLEMLTLAENPFLPAPVPVEFGKLTRLTYLWLSGMNMTGEIPESLSSLTELSLLAMDNNMLQGTIPTWVWQHKKLQYLYMFRNSFTGEISSSVTAVNLVELDVSSNIITGTIPEDFGKLISLTLLFLYTNQLHGPIPQSIGLLPNLYDIRLFDNMLSGPLPPELGKHSPLGNLEVCNNNLSGELPADLCSKRKLYDLVVFNNSFSGKLPESLDSCDLLTNIMLYNNHFTGEFPKSIWSVAKNQLTVVMVQNNNFSGTFPTQLPWNFTRLEISNNRFSGPIPTLAGKLKVFNAANNLLSGEIPWDLTGISQVNELDLSVNQITGSIPMAIGVLKLKALNLSGNQISGTIPAAFGFLSELNMLDLSSNVLSGTIPAALGILPGLTILDLSSNALSGEIPKDLNSLSLNLLNLSMNDLTGEIPTSFQNEAYEQSFLFNPALCVSSNNSIRNFPICRPRANNSNAMTRRLTSLFFVLASIMLVGSAVGGFLLLKRQNNGQDPLSWKLTQFHALHFTEYDVLSGLCEQNSIGSGRSGKVYRVCVVDGEGGSRMVAVKKIWNVQNLDKNLEKDFLAEVQILGEIRHTNIVKLLCCISSSEAKLLVYEYMENGSLDRWLHQRDGIGSLVPLDWPTRLQIAIDSARGLCYMHHGSSPTIVHCDVKSANILLDPEFRAKIADFGLARILLKAGDLGSVSAIGGTFGYMAPEYGYRRTVNEKIDVYSFGVVLLELTTGRVANDGDSEYCLAEWAWRQYQEYGLSLDLLDESIRDRAYMEDAFAVFMLGVICTGGQSSMRPSMKDVLHALLRFEHKSRERSPQHAVSEETSLLES